ncbi:MAG: hypothetical protein AB7Q01_08600 [Gammaproteobacteria bacterium]
MPINESAISERFEAGRDLMDLKYPSWRKAVEYDELSISSPHDCVLARHFGAYADGLDAIGLDHSDAPYYGFAIMVADFVEPFDAYMAEWEQYNALLSAMWKAEIIAEPAPA